MTPRVRANEITDDLLVTGVTLTRFALKEREHVSVQSHRYRFGWFVRWQKVLDSHKVASHLAFIIRVFNFPALHKFSCSSS
jgi:hypothetical protein